MFSACHYDASTIKTTIEGFCLVGRYLLNNQLSLFTVLNGRIFRLFNQSGNDDCAYHDDVFWTTISPKMSFGTGTLNQCELFGGFLKLWYPKMDGLYWKTLLKWMIWGYHHLRKHPFVMKISVRLDTIRKPHVWNRTSGMPRKSGNTTGVCAATPPIELPNAGVIYVEVCWGYFKLSNLEPETTVFKLMFGETTFFYAKIWDHPTETRIKKLLSRVPGDHSANKKLFT